MSTNWKLGPGAFDVFLCHNSEDKPAIRRIADDLIGLGIKPWLDEREITPGLLWQSALEDQIANIKSAAIFIGASGIGPWQNMEIKSFINEFVERRCPVIPVLLPSLQTKPNLPILLKNFHAVDFRKPSPDPMQQLVWGIKGERQEAPQLLDHESIGRIAAVARQSDLRIYPLLAETPSKEQRSQLFILLNKVKEFWIDGVLNHSLHNQFLISLGKAVSDEAVDTPFHRIIELPEGSGQFGNDAPIESVFDASGLLIILGEPGCGKTTTLLELAQSLVNRAETNPNERIPVVLNLSSWKKGQLLSDWILQSLTKIYNIPTKVAGTWLERSYLLPLLDGLDEVKPELQADCVAAINTYIDKHEPPGMVVCCRLLEYQWLPDSLKMNGAICIKPLDREQIDQYFAGIGQEFVPVKDAISADPTLQELAQSPFMLSIMSMAYQTSSHDSFTDKGQPLEVRREQIFAAYVDKVFQHKDSLEPIFSRDNVIFWLSSLAKNMQRHSQSLFLLENLQPTWLAGWQQQNAYRLFATLSFWAIVGLAVLPLLLATKAVGTDPASLSITGLGVVMALGLALRFDSAIINGVLCGCAFSLIGIVQNGLGDMANWLSDGIFYGLIAGVGVGTLNTIKTLEVMTWSWRIFFAKAFKGFGISGMLGGALSGILYGTMHSPKEGLMVGVVVGMLCGLLGGLIYGMVAGFTDHVSNDKTRPNQGIRLTLKNGALIGLMAAIVVGLMAGSIYGTTGPLLAGIITGLILGLSSGLIVGLNRGLATVIKHYSLRLILWAWKNTPLKLVPFLDYCAKLILLKKVGGGYIFIHRMLLEYFAKLEPVEQKSTKAK